MYHAKWYKIKGKHVQHPKYPKLILKILIATNAPKWSVIILATQNYSESNIKFTYHPICSKINDKYAFHWKRENKQTHAT